MTQRDKVNQWLTSRPTGMDVTPEVNNTLRLVVWAVVAVVLGLIACALSLYFTPAVEGAQQPTMGPLTATAEALFGCDVKYILTFKTDRNVRMVPYWQGASATPDNRTGKTVGASSGPVRAVDTLTDQDGDVWYQLCRQSSEWVVYDARLMSVVTVTPQGSATPTATPTLTATATATGTPRPSVTPTRLAAQIVYCKGTPTVTEIEAGLWRVVCDYR